MFSRFNFKVKICIELYWKLYILQIKNRQQMISFYINLCHKELTQEESVDWIWATRQEDEEKTKQSYRQ